MKNTTIYNTAKNRKATANEIAKYIMIDKLESIIVNECWGCENINDDELEQILYHFNKHLNSLEHRFNVRDIEVKF
jgi:hypothetical protein